MDIYDKIDAIEQAAYSVGGDIRYDYSGRGMFGKTCLGIVTDRPQRAVEEAAERGLRGAQTDSMGLQSIVYWPSVQNA